MRAKGPLAGADRRLRRDQDVLNRSGTTRLYPPGSLRSNISPHASINLLPTALGARALASSPQTRTGERGLATELMMAPDTPASAHRLIQTKGAWPARNVSAMPAAVLPFRCSGSAAQRSGIPPSNCACPMGLGLFNLMGQMPSASSVNETLTCWAQLRAARSVVMTDQSMCRTDWPTIRADRGSIAG